MCSENVINSYISREASMCHRGNATHTHHADSYIFLNFSNPPSPVPHPGYPHYTSHPNLPSPLVRHLIKDYLSTLNQELSTGCHEKKDKGLNSLLPHGPSLCTIDTPRRLSHSSIQDLETL